MIEGLIDAIINRLPGLKFVFCLLRSIVVVALSLLFFACFTNRDGVHIRCCSAVWDWHLEYAFVLA